MLPSFIRLLVTLWAHDDANNDDDDDDDEDNDDDANDDDDNGDVNLHDCNASGPLQLARTSTTNPPSREQSPRWTEHLES